MLKKTGNKYHRSFHNIKCENRVPYIEHSSKVRDILPRFERFYDDVGVFPEKSTT